MMLPVGWRSAQLGDLPIRIRGGVSPAAEDRPPAPGEVGVLRLSALNGGRFRPEESKALLAGTPVAQGATVRGGTVLISRSNTVDLVGATALVQRDFPDRILPDLIWSLDPAERDVVDPAWLSLELTASPVRRQIQAAASGTSGSMKKLSMGTLRRVKLMIPPILEQREIASTLGMWDSAAAKVEQLLSAKRRLKRGLMQQLLTGRRRFPRFGPNPWPIRRLSEITAESSVRNAGGLPLSRVMGVIKGIGLMPMKDGLAAASLDRYMLVRRSWFAYNPMRVNIGSIAMWEGEDDVLVSPDYVVFTCDDQELLPAYLSFLTEAHAWKAFVRRAGNGSVRVRIWFQDLGQIRVPLPTVEEQATIVSTLRALTREIRALEGIGDALCRQKRGLMQKLLTGQVRVKV